MSQSVRQTAPVVELTLICQSALFHMYLLVVAYVQTLYVSEHLSEQLVHLYLVSVEAATRFWQLGAGYEVRTPSSEFQAPRSILDDDKVDNVKTCL
jgi:hypothetical protein